jgi:hypothetical protein
VSTNVEIAERDPTSGFPSNSRHYDLWRRLGMGTVPEGPTLSFEASVRLMPITATKGWRFSDAESS